ncbi:hypothetical protein [Duganella violaceipulchra]|uniref:Uncharacterized protein n=1 Tax=Duganella violaceipulchra TaxID=2849652 RepID=A0AA41HIQ8_9BURK|nr:hypothetical protein [Duganella violaceicalia]MBV6325294.1 hypothetical protein [Duganella violaceicalia]MCP2012507.1 hypothetical protein [Duganella violaceicalia]
MKFEKWLNKTFFNIQEAIAHPSDALLGAAKGIANIPPQLAELLLKGAAEQQAAELHEAAAIQALLGSNRTAQEMGKLAEASQNAGSKFDLPKFKMRNAAEEGGDTVATIAQLFLGGVGVAKTAITGAVKLTYVTETVTKTAEEFAVQMTKAVEPLVVTAGSVGDGVRIVGRSAVPPRVLAARARQVKMLEDNVGYNISPTAWDAYPTIGRNGTFISDAEGILSYFKKYPASGEITVPESLVSTIEAENGLVPGTLKDGFKVRKITLIRDAAPRSPLEGNQYFLGKGNHLPGGSPELVIDSVPTIDNSNVKTIFEVKVDK